MHLRSFCNYTIVLKINTSNTLAWIIKLYVNHNLLYMYYVH